MMSAPAPPAAAQDAPAHKAPPAAPVPVVFLCLGSLGDVLPLLAVARRLAFSAQQTGKFRVGVD